MIGKIMSKASESIIGMLSAKPITMDNNASKFDFGTLLSSPEEQPQSEAGILELDVSKVENIAAGELGSAAVEHEKKAIILPMFNHNIRNAIYGREPSLNGPLDATEIAPASETPQVELTGDHDRKLTKAGLGNSDHIPASGSFHPLASGSVKNPQNRVIEDSIGLSEQPENSVAAVKRDVLLNSGSSQSAARFAGAPAGTAGFTTASGFDDVVGNFSGAVEWQASDNASIKVGYDGRLGEMSQSHGGFVRAVLPF